MSDPVWSVAAFLAEHARSGMTRDPVGIEWRLQRWALRRHEPQVLCRLLDSGLDGDGGALWVRCACGARFGDPRRWREIEQLERMLWVRAIYIPL